MTSFRPVLGSSSRLSATDCLVFECVAHPEATVEVWTDSPSGDWHAVPFEPIDGLASNSAHLQARISVDGPTRKDFEFTYRLRFPDGRIEWLGGNEGNGKLAFIPITALPIRLDEFWSNLPEQIKILPQTSSHSTHVNVLTYELPIETKPGEISSMSLGRPHSDAPCLLLERTNPYWQSTRLCQSIVQVSPDLETQFLAGQTEDPSTIYIVLPLATRGAMSVLCGSMTPNDTTTPFWLRCTKEAHDGPAKCIIGWARQSDFYRLMDEVTKVASSLIESQTTIGLSRNILDSAHGLRYCTWNGLGPDYKLSDLCNILDGLEESGAAKYFDAVLLDDGWQDVTCDQPHDQRRLQSFGAKDGWADVGLSEKDSEKRPADSGYASPEIAQGTDTTSQNSLVDLARSIKLVRKRYSSIKHVGCWITMTGYWRGIDAAFLGQIGFDSAAFTVSLPPGSQSTLHFLPLAQLQDFYHQYFVALKDAGVDYIKMDNQAMNDFIVDGPDYVETRHDMYAVAQTAAHAVFGVENVVHCMGHSARNMAGSFSFSGPQKLFRQFDDYLPDIADSHRRNTAHNIRNTVFSHSSQRIPDFDMFQSKHDFAAYHASLHAFTSAPIYLTDKIGQTDAAALLPLVGMQPDSTFKAIQALQPAALPAASIFTPVLESEGEFKAARLALAMPATKGAHLGLWNVGNGEVVESISAKDVLAVLESNAEFNHVIFAHRRDAILPSVAIGAQSLALKQNDFDILTIAPFVTIGQTQVAFLGLTDKYAGLAAISNVSVGQLEPQAIPSVTESHVKRCKATRERGLFAQLWSTFTRIISGFSKTLILLLGLRWTESIRTERADDEREPLLANASLPSEALDVQASKFYAAVGLRYAGNFSFVVEGSSDHIAAAIDNKSVERSALICRQFASKTLVTIPADCFLKSHSSASNWTVTISE